MTNLKLLWGFLLVVGLAVALKDYYLPFIVNLPSAPNLSLVDYIDKIVGWCVALAGAYNLIHKTKQVAPTEVIAVETTPPTVTEPKFVYIKPLELVPTETKAEQVKKLVKQDPKLAAQVLKDWIK